MKGTLLMATQDSFPFMTLDFAPVPSDPDSQKSMFCMTRSENKLAITLGISEFEKCP